MFRLSNGFLLLDWRDEIYLADRNAWNERLIYVAPIAFCSAKHEEHLQFDFSRFFFDGAEYEIERIKEYEIETFNTLVNCFDTKANKCPLWYWPRNE